MSEDKFYCDEAGCKRFVDKDHRCEQWSSVIRVPAGAVDAIRQEERRRADGCVRAYWPDQYAVCASILSETEQR